MKVINSKAIKEAALLKLIAQNKGEFRKFIENIFNDDGSFPDPVLPKDNGR